MSFEDIFRLVQSPFVILTGGEPTLYPLGPLVLRLKAERLRVHIETNATRCPDWLKSLDWITASPKPPDYAIADGLGNLVDEWKFVVTEGFSLDKIPKEVLSMGKPVSLQPMGLNPTSIRKALEALKGMPGLRLSLQTHKVLGLLIEERVA
jgi:organic radical activating enzyme